MKFPIKIGKIPKDFINVGINPGTVYMEKGNLKYGYNHILLRHQSEFEKANINPIDFAKWMIQNYVEIRFDSKKSTYWLIFIQKNSKSDKVVFLAFKTNRAKNYYTITSEGFKKKKEVEKLKLLCSRTPFPVDTLSGLGELVCKHLRFSATSNAQRCNSSQNNFSTSKVNKLKSKNTFLEGIADCYSSAEIKELGITEDKNLGKLNKKSVYETVNDLLINELQKGIIPWQKPWKNGEAPTGGGSFANFRTKRPYSGVNPWLIASKLKEHHCPYFLTLAQIQGRGGELKPGATRFGIVYFGSAIQNKTLDPTPEKPEGESMMRIIRFLKEYTVYNLSDTTLNIDWKKEKPEQTEEQILENCERVYEMYPNKPALKHGGNEAFYRPSADLVQMPPKKNFKKLPLYYTTLFHELIHSTGSAKRLKREFGLTFGNKKYAFEELIAEIGATYLCAHTGILFHSKNNSVAYLQGWMKALITEAKENKTFFFQAASKSQKAANFILSKQLQKAKSKKAKPKKDEVLGIIKEIWPKASVFVIPGKVKRTNIKLLKEKVSGFKGLGKLSRSRKFEPYTFTDHIAEFLLGRRIKQDSFKQWGDSNHITGKSGNVYRLHWFGNKGFTKERPLDQLADDFTSEYFQYSNMDTNDVINEMVEIITNYPSGAGAYMDDVNRAREMEIERYNQQNEEDEKEHNNVVATKKKSKRLMKAISKPKSDRKIVTSRRIYSTELTIIKNFINLDGKVVGQDSIANFYGRIKKAKTSKQIDTHRTIIADINQRIHKALGFALESPENKITINLDPEFKKKCQESIKNAQVKVRTEYLAGKKKKSTSKPVKAGK